MKKEMVAMLLAGGKGTRLKDLTKNMAKPAVEFGGRYRLIDFPLSNCTHSGIDTVGVLTQYEPIKLNHYIGSGSKWDLDFSDGGVHILSPFTNSKGNYWFKGTAHAIWAHKEFIKSYEPQYVLILSGDHIYNMDYSLMLEEHKKKNNELTICVKEVPLSEASRFGLAICDNDDKIINFEEKPEVPSTNLASMGIYIFNYSTLVKYLKEESKTEDSEFDFGKNVIPSILSDGCRIGAYRYDGYWKDVGTIQSLWEANMDLLEDEDDLIYNSNWVVFSNVPNLYPSCYTDETKVENSIINEGCGISATIKNSIISYNCVVNSGSLISKSVLQSNCVIGNNVHLKYVIVQSGTQIPDNSEIKGTKEDILLVTNEYVENIMGVK